MRASSPIVVAVLLCIIILPPFYVASCGPAIWCRDRGIVDQGTVLVVYWPVSWAMQNVPIVGSAIDRYLRLWYSPNLWPPPNQPSAAH